MSFAEIASNRPSPVGCPIGRIMAGLPDDETVVLKNMLAADIETWPHTGGTKPEDSIQLAFKAEGYEVSDRNIRAHRAETCRCARADR